MKTFWLFFYIMLQRKKERNRYLRKISHCIKMRTETPSPANCDLLISQTPGQLHFDPSWAYLIKENKTLRTSRDNGDGKSSGDWQYWAAEGSGEGMDIAEEGMKSLSLSCAQEDEYKSRF